MLKSLNDPGADKFEIIRTKNLIKNKKYKILDFFVMTTKYGKKVVASLEGGKYFLPPRYGLIIRRMAKDPEEIDCENMYMIFEGNLKNTYRSPILKFVKEEKMESSDDEDEDGAEAEE